MARQKTPAPVDTSPERREKVRKTAKPTMEILFDAEAGGAFLVARGPLDISETIIFLPFVDVVNIAAQMLAIAASLLADAAMLSAPDLTNDTH